MVLSIFSRRLAMALVLTLSSFSFACSGDQPTNTASGTNSASKRPPAGPPLYEGFFDIANCDVIHGWVWNVNDPDTPVSVEVYDGETLLAEVEADEPRGDLVAAGKGSGNYGFSYIPPPVLKDNKPRSIRVKVEGSNFELGNSPKTITCPPQ